MRLAEVVLWGSLAVTFYAYGLYPLVIWAFSRWKRRPAEGNLAIEADAWPSVTLLIRAGRDEHCIAKRLENALALDYPRERLQILVGCAGEEDLTGLLARSFDRRLVEVVQIPKRGEFTCWLPACGKCAERSSSCRTRGRSCGSTHSDGSPNTFVMSHRSAESAAS